MNESRNWTRAGHGLNNRVGVPAVMLLINSVHTLLVVSDVSLTVDGSVVSDVVSAEVSNSWSTGGMTSGITN